MQKKDDLYAELSRLDAVFSGLSERLTKAAEQFRQVGASPADDLVAALAEYEKGFATLANRIVDYGREVSLPAEQIAKLPSSTLDDLKNSIQAIADFEEQRRKDALKRTAVAALDRALGVVRRDRAKFPALLSCQAKSTALRGEILNYSGPDLHPAVQELCEGEHPIARLLSLVERQGSLTDGECLNFHETVVQAFGKELAIAATRGKLEVQAAPPPAVVPAPESLPEDALAELQKLAAKEFAAERAAFAPPPAASSSLSSKAQRQQGGAFSGSGSGPAPSGGPEVEEEIDAILENISGWGIKTSQAASSAAAAPATVAPPLKWRGTGKPVAAPEKAQDAAAGIPAGTKPQLSANDVMAHVVEAVEMERLAALFCAQGKDSEAESLYEQLLALQRGVLAPHDPRIAETLGNLTALRHKREKSSPAGSPARPAEVQEEKARVAPPMSFSRVPATPDQAPAKPAASPALRNRAVLGCGAALVLAVVGYAALGHPLVQAAKKRGSPVATLAASAPPESATPAEAAAAQSPAAPHPQNTPSGQEQSDAAPTEQASAKTPEAPAKPAPEAAAQPKETAAQKANARRAAGRQDAVENSVEKSEQAHAEQKPTEPVKEARLEETPKPAPVAPLAAAPVEAPQPAVVPSAPAPNPPPAAVQQAESKPQPAVPAKPAEARVVEPTPSKLSSSLEPPAGTTTLAEARAGMGSSAATRSIPAPPQEPVRIAGPSAAAKLVHQTQPAYPPGALQRHVEGTVHLEVLIARDGSVGKVTVVSGPPLLDDAAANAIRNWRYKPTIVNGAPVEVLTNVDVSFKMAK